MNKTQDFQAIQHAFIDHIKNPQTSPAPADIEDRRMGVYRDLFFNNVNGFVDSAFPVLKSLYQEEDWLRLVRVFFSQHQCRSPLFLEISKEFVEFLQNEYQPESTTPPFVLELAHYEWVELVVATQMEHHFYPIMASLESVKKSPLVMSEFATSVSYQFPVHTISVDFQPNQPSDEATYLVVYRATDHEVKFLQINVITALLIQLIDNQPGIKWQQLIDALLQQLPQFSQAQLEQGAEQIILDLAHKGIVRRFVDSDQ